MRAIAYVRVSSREQVKGLSLETQEEACRAYCEREGWELVEVFREEGESARTTDRTQLKALMEYCRRHRGQVETLLVYKLNRFARDRFGHHAMRAHLMRLGVTLRSVTERFDDSPEGEFFESIFAAAAQYDNALRAEAITRGMKAAVERGRWLWRAPLGYENCQVAGSKTIRIDPVAGELVREAYRLASSGFYTQAEILKKVTAQGLRTRRGLRLKQEGLKRILTNPVYAGRLVVKSWGTDQPGDWEPLVDDALWSRAQRLWSQKRPNAKPYLRSNPDFPLRAFVRCGSCDRPLTGSFSRGRTRRYGYYHCGSCGRQRIPKRQLESDFLALLEGLRPDEDLLKLWRAIVLDVWQERQAEVGDEIKRLRQHMEELSGRKRRLVEAYVYDQAVDEATYKAMIDELDEGLTLAVVDLEEAKIDDLDVEHLIRFAETVLESAARMWNEADLEQKQRLQQVIFPEGLAYRKNEGFGTAVTIKLFSYLQPDCAADSRMVEPKGIEPSTS